MSVGRIVVPESCKDWLKLQRPDRDYAAETEADYASIVESLPSGVSSILDIGCGMAGIDVYLKRRYPEASLSLLDGNGTSNGYSFSQTPTAYSNRRAADELLDANGVRVDRWHDVGTKELLKADLVISLLSWGFHYPLSTYNVRGFCIADIRRTHENVRGKVIYSSTKFDRCAFTCG